jgi:hypothetical protein
MHITSHTNNMSTNLNRFQLNVKLQTTSGHWMCRPLLRSLIPRGSAAASRRPTLVADGAQAHPRLDSTAMSASPSLRQQEPHTIPASSPPPQGNTCTIGTRRPPYAPPLTPHRLTPLPLRPIWHAAHTNSHARARVQGRTDSRPRPSARPKLCTPTPEARRRPSRARRELHTRLHTRPTLAKPARERLRAPLKRSPSRWSSA